MAHNYIEPGDPVVISFKQHFNERARQIPGLIRFIKDSNFQSSSEAKEALKAATNMVSLGFGHFSTVYQGPEGPAEYVLKIFDGVYGSGEQDPWPHFADLAQDNEANPLFPKVVYWEIFPAHGYLGIIEKLEINRGKLDAACREPMLSVRSEMGFPKAVPTPSPIRAQGLTRGRYFTSFAFAVPQYLKSKTSFNPYNAANTEKIFKAVEACMTNLGVSYEHLKDFYDKVQKLGRWDMHAGNAGFRSNGQVVFFDPVAL